MNHKIGRTILIIGILLSIPKIVMANGESISEVDAYVTLESYDDEAGEGPVNPLEPTMPVTPVDPEQPSTNGPLRIVYISNLTFGKQQATGVQTDYFAQLDQVKTTLGTIISVPNSIQISDHRGMNAGWQLYVSQDQPLTNGNHELLGTELRFENPVWKGLSNDSSVSPTAPNNVMVTPEGEAILIAYAEVNKGMGTWVEGFGKDISDGAKSVVLSVPGKADKKAGFYQTSLTWQLLDVPLS